MKELEFEKKMSIKEVAEILNKDESTVRKIGKNMFPEMFRNGLKTYLDEKKVTAIKLNLGKNSELPKTALEETLLIKQGYALLIEREERLLAENSSLKLENQRMKPKEEFFDRVTESNKTIDMAECSKILNVPGIGRNKMFSILRGEKVLRENNIPYQKYCDRKYFKVVEVETPAGIKLKTVVYQKGLDYIRKVISK